MADHPVIMTTIAMVEDEAYVVCDRCGTLWSGPYDTARQADLVAELMNLSDDSAANLRPMREQVCCTPVGRTVVPDTVPAGITITPVATPAPDTRPMILVPEDPLLGARTSAGWDLLRRDADPAPLSPAWSELVPADNVGAAVASNIGHHLAVAVLFPFWLIWAGLRWLVRHGRLLARLVTRWEFWAVAFVLIAVGASNGPSASELARGLITVGLVLLALALIGVLVVVYVQVWRRASRPPAHRKG